MAIGLGLMFGFVFAKNFDSPYLAQSMTDFWRRWHISLSTWLRDYLYVPLGGNRKGPRRTYVNLFVVMLLGGLWHGAAWNFVIWGGLHGLLLAYERMRGKAPAYGRFGNAGAGRGHVRPRAGDLGLLPRLRSAVGDAVPRAHGRGSGTAQEGAALLTGIVYQPYYLGTFVLAAIVTWACPQTWDWTRVLTAPKAVAVAALFVLAAVLLTTQAYNPFIYFIF